MDTTQAIRNESVAVDDGPGANRGRRLIAVSAVIVLIGAIVVAVVVGQRGDGDGSAGDVASGTTQRVEGGNVTVAATWKGLAGGPVFDIALDTHSVDLDGIDLLQLAVLRVDGVEVQPVSWDAPKGGHHREGTLAFPEKSADGRTLIGADTTSVELVIRDVAGVAERAYQWNP